jgi:hypothetical protein
MNNFDRAIDDPGLNQDSTFDHKDSEDFDVSDDFRKLDDTTKDHPASKKSSSESANSNKKNEGSSDFDGYMNI